jgi:hypothetical protein
MESIPPVTLTAFTAPAPQTQRWQCARQAPLHPSRHPCRAKAPSGGGTITPLELKRPSLGVAFERRRCSLPLCLPANNVLLGQTKFVLFILLVCIEHAMLKRTLLILGLVATLCVIGVVGWFFFFGDTIQDYLRRRPFDSAALQGQKTGTNDVRIRMVDDLLRRHSFRGITREQVTAIVGEPDKTAYFKEWDLVYWLGPERGFISIDSEWLVFRLDSQKKVTDLRIVRD